MNRIEKKFESLKKNNEKALIPFITAGDPELSTTIELVLAMEKAGADIVELGIPYSDPLADGPVIQASSSRALSKGIKIINIMDMVKKIREKTEVPLVYLVYYNSVFKYGMEKFMQQCSQVGIDGLIIPDLPLEERAETIAIADKNELCLIPLVAPTSKERIKGITHKGKGFVYCVSVNGVTGTRNSFDTNIDEYMKNIESYTDMPKALGFGISNAEMAKKYSKYCQGVIIGSAIIKIIQENKDENSAIEEVYKFVHEIKEAITL